jgi:hypothetical protein
MHFVSQHITPRVHPISMCHTPKEPLTTLNESLPVALLKVTWLRNYGQKTTATPSKNVAFGLKIDALFHRISPGVKLCKSGAALPGSSGPTLLPPYKMFGYLCWGKKSAGDQ